MINISSTSTMSGWYVSDIGQIMLPYFCWFLRPLWKNREPCGMYWSYWGSQKTVSTKRWDHDEARHLGMVNPFLESWLVVDLPLWKMMDFVSWDTIYGKYHSWNSIFPYENNYSQYMAIPNIWQFPIKLFHGWFGIPEIWDSILKIKERYFHISNYGIFPYIQLSG